MSEHATGRFQPVATIGQDGQPVMLQRATPAGVALTRVGIAFAYFIALLYGWGGSPISGFAFTGVATTLLIVHLLVPQEVPLTTVASVVSIVIWIATLVVGLRTGGSDSPMIMWNFFPPISMYVLCGRRAGALWTALSFFQIGVLSFGDQLGLPITNDLQGNAAAVHRTALFLVSIVTIALVVTGNESYRTATQDALEVAGRTMERQRILGDMHDGVGSQLMGLMLQVRAHQIDEERLLQGLGSALDDLKLIVDSLDPTPRSFDLAIAEMRARVQPRFDAANMDLKWSVAPRLPSVSAEPTVQVLRAIQEMTTNALRHSGATSVEFSLGVDDAGTCMVSVTDNGRGFNVASPERAGRGLVSLQTRARRLGGSFEVHSEPGRTRTSLVFTPG
jgi:signal transduction histidine kinase